MNVLFFRDGFYPPDQRIEHQARTLHAAGYRVTVLALAHDQRDSTDQTLPWCRVRRFSLPHLARGESLRLLLTGSHPGLERLLESVAVDAGARAIQVIDLPRLPVALRVGERLGVPVIYDRWENYPEAMRVQQRARRAASLFERLYHGVSRWRRIERRAAPRSAAVICTVEESRDDLRRRLHLPAERLALVPNYPDPALFQPVDDESRRRVAALWPANVLCVAYLGVFGPHRGLDGLIDAVALARRRRQDLFLALVGAGFAGFDVGARLAERGLAGASFVGPVSHDDLPAAMARADIVAVPHRKNPHTDTTVPWKLFQAMMLSKPVLAGNPDPIRRVVEESGCGRVGDADRPESLAAALEALLDPAVRAACGQAGRRAFEQRFHWRFAAAELLTLYRRVVGAPTGA